MNPRLPGSETISDDDRPARGQPNRNEATLVALVFMFLCSIGFLGLVVLILPDVAFVVIPLGLAILMFAFHYFTWGRWLTNRLREEREREANRRD